MKKINVIVKEKTILELTEDAFKGDIIDLKELVKVDTSYIDSVIEAGKDKIYLNKLEDAKKVIMAENQIKISQLEQKIQNLEKENLSNIKLKEKEIDLKYEKIIDTLEKKVEQLNHEKEYSLKIQEQEKEAKYNKLVEEYNILKSQVESQIKQRELEVENKYINDIKSLENEKLMIIANKESELEQFKVLSKLELECALNEQKEKYKEEIHSKDDIIQTLQRQKASMNVKQTGEDLESWCNNEVLSYMQNGLFNCTWNKDNTVVKKEGEAKGSKADYIFKIYASEEHNENELLTSICLEMKDENPDSKTKQTNEHYYKKLDENKNKKKCKYAVLVSNLETDKPNILPIYKVREYENMYVVRPGYMMVFLNMIASLTSRFSELLLNKDEPMLELKNKIELINEFNKIKNTYLDAPLDGLEKSILAITTSSQAIKDAASNIDMTCAKINDSYISKISKKLENFELKVNRKIVNKLD